MFKKYLINEHETIEFAIEKILFNNYRTVLVESRNNKIIGTISEGDVMRAILKKKNLNSPAYKIMNSSFKKQINKLNISKAKKIFMKYNLNILPLLSKEHKLLKIITLKDLI